MIGHILHEGVPFCLKKKEEKGPETRFLFFFFAMILTFLKVRSKRALIYFCIFSFILPDAQQIVSIYLLCYVRLSTRWSCCYMRVFHFVLKKKEEKGPETRFLFFFFAMILTFLKVRSKRALIYFCIFSFILPDAQQIVSIYLLCYVRLSTRWSCCSVPIQFYLK